ncbi:nicotinate-nucleotide pyrophosphorylase [carboxylating] [Thermosyntropha lipolytica DSM 11003]|uniref:Probable nicotinate-nucleotide pyrophosphorylase [carboxylating] n=1 Tax=Thermosyntropha lipolytica DSM 11003 TaxID=1123382 RepID=A0A1M5JUS6_9FIRM|nr:carboxylating nicotinate-nucleotide diphosphorylase [Thermosyntropha lipolytica]SHG44362.1 nicotinate-nucleotide pyrophosphorylase [carboxylating] [Thermosyntropha lipolytica DSM 11003]
MENLWLEDLIRRALQEDIGHGDITTENLIPPEHQSCGEFIAKAEGILAGIEVCRAVFAYLDKSIAFEALKQDGDQVRKGEVIARVRGNTRCLLMGERLALNFLQRMSGIATKTCRLAEKIKPYPAVLVDTRKTTPGLRYLEKYAVAAGGGRNHRFGLYDGVMIKDNHIKAAGGIRLAVEKIRGKIPHTIKIEVEVENLEQLKEALEAGADIILLDNMPVDMLQEAVAMAKGKALLEASGGVDEHNIEEIARTGVDFISCGALTHSAPSLDISFNLL